MSGAEDSEERAPGTGWPVAAFLVAAVTLALTLRGWWPLSRRRDDKWVQLLVLPPAFLGAFLMTLQVYAEPLEKWLWWGIVLSLLFLVLQALAGFWSEVWRLHQGWRAWVLVAVLPPAAAAISGFVTGCFAPFRGASTTSVPARPLRGWCLRLVRRRCWLRSRWASS